MGIRKILWYKVKLTTTGLKHYPSSNKYNGQELNWQEKQMVGT